MNRFLRLCLAAVVLLTAAVSSPFSLNANAQQTYREIVGSVRDQHGAPVKNAVVQLENEDVHSVQSYTTDADGSFHFKHVLGDVDFEVSASISGMTSKKVSISKFDDKTTKFIKLTIDTH